jgi:hypothetical protein
VQLPRPGFFEGHHTMNDKMQVLFVKQTGHVLAAFTRTADPEGKPQVSDLTGSGLSVHNLTRVSTLPPNGGETLAVPPEALDVAVVENDPDIFATAVGFVASGGRVARLGTGGIVLNGSPPPSPPPATPPPPTPSQPQVNFSVTRVTVTLESDTTDDKGVCVVVQEAAPSGGNDPERRVAQGVLTSGTHFVSLDWKTSPDGVNASISISSGDFFVLALVAGYQPLFGRQAPA